MNFEEFIHQVAKRGKLKAREEAERITTAVLNTLGERLSRREREKVATQLPKQLAGEVMSVKENPPDPFNLEEFYTRVKARAGIGFPKAVPMSQVVISVLQDSIAAGEQEQVLFELPDEYKELFGVKPESPEFVRYTSGE